MIPATCLNPVVVSFKWAARSLAGDCAQCIAAMVGASDEEAISCMEALANDTNRALRWQLLRAPLDEDLLRELVREYCAVRGLAVGALNAGAGGTGAAEAAAGSCGREGGAGAACQLPDTGAHSSRGSLPCCFKSNESLHAATVSCVRGSGPGAAFLAQSCS